MENQENPNGGLLPSQREIHSFLVKKEFTQVEAVTLSLGAKVAKFCLRSPKIQRIIKNATQKLFESTQDKIFMIIPSNEGQVFNVQLSLEVLNDSMFLELLQKYTIERNELLSTSDEILNTIFGIASHGNGNEE